MKERSILMSAPMVRAILAGKKTQTRRPVKPMKHPFGNLLSIDDVVAEWTWGTGAVACPFGRKGDRLWVRETWSEAFTPGGASVVAYRAGGCIAIGRDTYDGPKYLLHVLAWQGTPEPNSQGWRPSIHMPRWASRITLEITNVRVEQLREITVEDAAAEGFTGHDPIAGFADTWNEIYGGLSWANNPWVWVVEFRRVEQ